jgi:hypothetical protein
MGLLISTLRDNFFGAMQAKIIMVGLEAAGTPTIPTHRLRYCTLDGKAFVILPLKVHKNENFFGFDFEFCTISVLVMHK